VTTNRFNPSFARFDFKIRRLQTGLMDPLRELGRALLILGGVSALVGALLFFGGRLPFRLGRLPGDIIHRGEHTTFYFPIMTCLVISVVLSILFWLFSNFRR
jgi:Protein of unknown function (DUF2905)